MNVLRPYGIVVCLGDISLEALASSWLSALI